MAITLKDKEGNAIPLSKTNWKEQVCNPSAGLAKVQEDAKPKKYSRILNLPAHFKQQIDDMLRAGYESSVVARTIQKDLGFHNDISEDGMRMYISRYRQEMIPINEQLPVVGSALFEHNKKRLFKDVELLENMTAIIETQMNRIAFDHTKEKAAKMSLMQNNNNISVCFKGMRDYGELAIKIGLLKKLGDDIDRRNADRPTALLDAALQNPDVRTMVHNSLNAMLINLEKPEVVDAYFEESDPKK